MKNPQIILSFINMVKNTDHRIRFIVGTISIGLIIVGIRLVAYQIDPDDEVLSVGVQSTGKIVLAGKFRNDYISRRNADGTNDADFAKNWLIGGFNAPVHKIVIEKSDDYTKHDRIIAVGQFTNFDDAVVGYIARLDKDGNLDRDFANNIGTGFDNTVHTVSIQPNGKILVGGDFTSFNGTKVSFLAKLNPDGTLDSTFNEGDGFDLPVYTIDFIQESQILVGGEFRYYNNSRVSNFVELDETGKRNPASDLKIIN
ncbi:MAG: hypothetical protein HY843_08585 [Bdellovibrio sp.]|nr:hypothetical protein [Bdellovibrio sp.]